RQNLDTATLTRDFLRRKQAEAEASVDAASRALAQFLAEHPQFQWGANDSPYAPAPVPSAGGAPAPLRPRPSGARSDPVLAGLEPGLGRADAGLFPGQPSSARSAPGAALAEAQKQRDAAAAELVAAQKALAEKLYTVKPAHPDAVSAAARVKQAE